jgi:hypothetical protein
MKRQKVRKPLMRQLEPGDKVTIIEDEPRYRLEAGDVGIVELVYGEDVYEIHFVNKDGKEFDGMFGSAELAEPD